MQNNKNELVDKIHKIIGIDLMLAGQSFQPKLLKEIVTLVIEEYERLTKDNKK